MNVVVGQWNHIVGSYNPSTGGITINVNDHSRTGLYREHGGFDLNTTTNPLYIGRGAFNGRIDEVKISQGNQLAGEWNFDELPPGTQTPQVVLNGQAEMTLETGVYIEEGATATDAASEVNVVDSGPNAIDGIYHVGDTSVPVSTAGSVGTNPGDYTITYTATDASGNTATATRLVHVAFSTSWTQVNGSASDIGVGGGFAWIVGASSRAYRSVLTGAGTWGAWEDMWHGANRIDVDNNGGAWVVYDGNIWHHDGSWTQVPGKALDIDAGGDGSVWITHTGGGISRWNHAEGKWDRTNGDASQISAGQNGTPWVVQSDASIWTDAEGNTGFEGITWMNHLQYTTTTFNGSQGRYVRVSLPRSGVLSLAEVQVFDSDGVNVALDQPTSQSTTDHGGSASRADGNTDGNFGSASTTHTRNNTPGNPWWEVDLGSVTSVSRIIIHNRTDGWTDRLNDAQVEVSITSTTPPDIDAPVITLNGPTEDSIFFGAVTPSWVPLQLMSETAM